MHNEVIPNSPHQRRPKRTALLGGVLALAGSPLVACGLEQPESAESATTPLYGGGTAIPLWPGGNVPVCWESGDATNPSLAPQRTRIREAVENTWARVANITFTGWNACPASGDFLRLGFTPAGSGGVASGHTVKIAADPLGFWNRGLGIHEVGHAIGWVHEQERPDDFDANGNPIHCSIFDGNSGPFSRPGGQVFTPYDIDSIMNYCHPDGQNFMSPGDVFGAREAYGPGLNGAPTCQQLSDKWGITAGLTWGFAPQSARDRWEQLRCQAKPNSPDTCQKISNFFGTDSTHVGPFISNEAKTFWNSNSCATRPRFTLPTCQRAADSYGIIANLSWGTAPPEVRSWWTGASCTARFRNPDDCQHASDLYGLKGSATNSTDDGTTTVDAGWAPAAVRDWFQDRGCRTKPVTSDRCQLAADLFAIRAGVSWGFAAQEQKDFWMAKGCGATASSPNDCQSASDMFGITANVTWGFATQEAKSLWQTKNCSTKASSANVCQTAADNFGIIPNFSFAFAPPNVQSFWTTENCSAHPKL